MSLSAGLLWSLGDEDLVDFADRTDVADNTNDVSKPVTNKSIHGAPNHNGPAGGIHNDTAVSQRQTMLKKDHPFD